MEPTRSHIGRPRFGGSEKTLILLSLLCGVSSATALGTIAAWTPTFRAHPLLAIAIITACLAPVLTVTAWGLMVDRRTLDGAVEQPEESIENHWYAQAAEDAFHLALCSVGALGVTSIFWNFSIKASTLAISLGALFTVGFALSYNIHKLRQK
ncbi:hypothetical protein ACGE24_08080 [Corynebacterium kroppenstedtii]|uniref:hypothetical protein n=1 Tax=Corynebacterium sp. PCR 32 TaxID=3351342 RepID=UPI003094E1D5